MERAVAVKKLAKLLGKSLGYRVDDEAPTAEQRAAARADFEIARVERDKAKERKLQRYEAILAADQEYQSLKAAYNAAQARCEKLGFQCRHYKFTVGTTNGLFFTIKAEGDSWEEIIDKLQTKVPA